MALWRDYSLEQMYITQLRLSLFLNGDSCQQRVRLSWRGLSEASACPSGFALITPAEHTRRKAKPQGGILIKMSPISVGHCDSLNF